MPVGFKNNSSGDYEIAANAIISAKHPHCFYGIDENGKASIVSTKGNDNCHVILRGSKYGTNYDKREINFLKDILQTKNLRKNVMVDCSHGNSNKDYRNQPSVFNYLKIQLVENQNIIVEI